MTRDEVTSAINAADERIARLRPRVREAPDAPLLSGQWCVRDALSHVAARANALPVVQRYVERSDQAAAGGGQQPAITNIDEVNAGQVQERTGASVDDLLDETLAGHRATLEHLAGLDDALLDRRLKVAWRPDEISVGEFIVIAGVGHEATHLSDVEAALEKAGTGAR